MNFNEQPLTYHEALGYIHNFERRYKVASEELLRALKSGDKKFQIDSDDLYEWQTYLHFTQNVEMRLKEALSAPGVDFSEMIYSRAANTCVKKKSAAAGALERVELAA